MDSSQPQPDDMHTDANIEHEVEINISNEDPSSLHSADTTEVDAEAGTANVETDKNKANALANILADNNVGSVVQASPNGLDAHDQGADEDDTQQLKIRVNEKGDHMDYHTDEEHSHAVSNTGGNHNGEMAGHVDTMRWFRMGTDRSQTPDTRTSNHSKANLNDTTYDLYPTQDEQWENYILHLRHIASYKAEFDIYQILAYRAKISYGQKIFMKPLKTLKGLIPDTWADLEVRWLNSFQRVLFQAIICWSIQTIGVTTVIATQFSSYFADQGDYAQCDSSADRWKQDWHLKVLAFLWTSFIALGVSGWIYRARHSGFYPILLFLRQDQIPPFVSVTILQVGLLTNYYVVASSVIGSFILIYQTEGGTETIGMILQAVALFFVLELDNKMVHSRDFLSIRKYFDLYIKNGKHKKFPQTVLREDQENCLQKPIKKCRGNSCLGVTLSMSTFVLLIIMTMGACIAPWLIMICW